MSFLNPQKAANKDLWLGHHVEQGRCCALHHSLLFYILVSICRRWRITVVSTGVAFKEDALT
jgi:hypothetical protein